MPSASPRPCTYPRCRSLVTKGSRCEAHARPAWQSNAGKSSTERGYGSSWRSLRDAHIKAEPLCRECKSKGRITAAAEVDHILAKAHGGTEDDGNLQSLCRDCHEAKTIRERGVNR